MNFPALSGSFQLLLLPGFSAPLENQSKLFLVVSVGREISIRGFALHTKWVHIRDSIYWANRVRLKPQVPELSIFNQWRGFKIALVSVGYPHQ